MRQRDARQHVQELRRFFPVIALVGPRQAGKTTLARAEFPDRPYQSLENPDTRWQAESDPRGFLSRFPEGAILDEIQRVPSLFSYLQQIVDESPAPGRWVLTGSHQFGLRGASVPIPCRPRRPRPSPPLHHQGMVRVSIRGTGCDPAPGIVSSRARPGHPGATVVPAIRRHLRGTRRPRDPARKGHRRVLALRAPVRVALRTARQTCRP